MNVAELGRRIDNQESSRQVRDIVSRFKHDLLITTVCSSANGLAVLDGVMYRNYLQVAVGIAGSFMCAGYTLYSFVDGLYKTSRYSEDPMRYFFDF